MAPTYSYGYDPVSSDTDRLRLMLGDTGTPTPSASSCIFADEEISWFVSEGHGNSHLAAHHACVAAAAKFSQLADKTLGPMSIKYGMIAQSFRDQAVEEFGNATNSANVSPQPYSFTSQVGDRDVEIEDEYTVYAEFRRNMMDNMADTSAGMTGEGRTHWSF